MNKYLEKLAGGLADRIRSAANSMTGTNKAGFRKALSGSSFGTKRETLKAMNRVSDEGLVAKRLADAGHSKDTLKSMSKFNAKDSAKNADTLVKNRMKNLDNKYLTKLSSTALGRYSAAKGTSISNTGKVMSNAELVAAHNTGSAGKGSMQGYATTRKVHTAETAAQGFPGIRAATNPLRPVHTNDVLASQPNPAERLAANKTGPIKKPVQRANIPGSRPPLTKSKGVMGEKGIMGKVLSFAKKNPKLSMGLGAGAALLGAHSSGKAAGRNEAYGN
jgi:hypothetical protein